MGYGYGVWLVVENLQILDAVYKNNKEPYISHVTLMCNMTRDDAIALSDEIHGKYDIFVDKTYNLFNNPDEKYSDKDILSASGFYCRVPLWEKLIDTAKKYSGTISEKPHISIAYRTNENELPENVNIKNVKVTGFSFPANTVGDIPKEWKIINSIRE